MIKRNRTAPTTAEPCTIPAFSLPASVDLHREPTAAELEAIENEWPLIAAEIAVVDAEIAVLCAPRSSTDLAWRRLRRARGQVLRQVAALASHTTPSTARSAA